MGIDTALVIIDMQMEMQHRIDAGRPHFPAGMTDAVAKLATAFRQAGRPVIHIRHADADPASPLYPGSPGYPAMPCALDLPGEAVFVKTTSSAFASTALAAHLRQEAIAHLYVAGAVAGFCVNSTIRSAADQGFAVTAITDAILGFDLPVAGLDARTIFDVTMGLLAADFADLRDSRDVVASLAAGTR